MNRRLKSVLLACFVALGLAACATGGDGQSLKPDRPQPNYDYTR